METKSFLSASNFMYMCKLDEKLITLSNYPLQREQFSCKNG